MANFNAESPFNRPLSYSSSIYSEVTVAAPPHSPSIYSQDIRSPPTTPTQTQSHSLLLITRQDSVRSTAASSTVSSTLSRAPTIYSEETIKALGYRPFEYWKGPKRAPYPADYHKHPQRKAVATAAAAANSDNNSDNGDKAQQISSPPRARLRDGLESDDRDVYVDLAPPTSPTVKDRYRQRQRQRQIDRAKKQRAAVEWPHWVPSSAAKKADRSRHKKPGWTRLNDFDDEKALDGRGATSPASSLKTSRKAAWRSPRSWRRRTWGIILIFLVLCAVGAVITLVNLPIDKLVGSERW